MLWSVYSIAREKLQRLGPQHRDAKENRAIHAIGRLAQTPNI